MHRRMTAAAGTDAWAAGNGCLGPKNFGFIIGSCASWLCQNRLRAINPLVIQPNRYQELFLGTVAGPWYVSHPIRYLSLVLFFSASLARRRCRR